jgi:predicted RNase H-like HicB family nuclease
MDAASGPRGLRMTTFCRGRYTIEFDREDDGRWIADIPALPGVMAYGRDRTEAVARVRALAARVLADRAAHGEPIP